MNSIVEGKVRLYLQQVLGYDQVQAGTILHCMRNLGRCAGFDVDARLGQAGMAAGPEGRIASAIIDRALIGGKPESTDYQIRTQIETWLRTTAPTAE
jgi:hypothetical protein